MSKNTPTQAAPKTQTHPAAPPPAPAPTPQPPAAADKRIDPDKCGASITAKLIRATVREHPELIAEANHAR